MTELDELFREAVSAPPPSRLTATAVLGAAGRRHRRQAALAAAVVITLGGLVGIGITGLSLGSRNAANPPGSAAPPGSLIWAGRGDATHLYRLTYSCGENPRLPQSYPATATPGTGQTTPACNRLWASADGGASWTSRDSTVAQELIIAGPTTLLRYAGDANTPDPATVPVELSTDAGATWKPVAHNGTPIAGIPAGGVLTPYTSPDGMLVFDPAQGNLRPLANGPRLSAVAGGLVVNGRGPTSTVWWGGGGTDGRASVAVSHDGGATWLQRELPGLAYGSTPRPYVFGLASRDGTTAYAFAYDNHASVRTPDPAIAGTEGFGWVRVFRTTDGGNTWQDLDPAAVMPSYAHVWMTADGRLVLALLNPRMDGAPTPSAEPSAVAGAAEFAVSDDGRTFRVAAPAGLPGALFDVDGSVAYSDRAMYVSDDGWTWREVWHE